MDGNMGRLLEISNGKVTGSEPMHSVNELLIDQLDSINRPFASFARVIIHTSEMLTKGSSKNDFSHSEAVHRRLSELFPNARQSYLKEAELFPNVHQSYLKEAEIFILIASAYLHDIGHLNISNGQRHGESSADMISNDDSLKYIFPAGDILNQVAKICDYHDREIEELKELEQVVKLDIRPCHCYISDDMRVRPRMLGAIFRLADELECNSDRMLGQSANKDDTRTIIAGVRIDLESRCICLDFKHGATEEKRNKCTEYLCRILKELEPFLDPYGLSFEIVDKLPEIELIDEEEGVHAQLDVFDDVKESSKSFITPQKATNFYNLMEMYKSERMNRIDSVTSILFERGIKE